jgi:DNA-binding MarR family transcriptional regulator
MRAADLHRLARQLREIALEATGNTGSDHVNAGELAILEDVARNPEATIHDITSRTGLAQSLVSRVVHLFSERSALTITPDNQDRRRVLIKLSDSARAMILDRAGNSIDAAVAAQTPLLSADERTQLISHLAAAAALINSGTRP